MEQIYYVILYDNLGTLDIYSPQQSITTWQTNDFLKS